MYALLLRTVDRLSFRQSSPPILLQHPTQHNIIMSKRVHCCWKQWSCLTVNLFGPEKERLFIHSFPDLDIECFPVSQKMLFTPSWMNGQCIKTSSLFTMEISLLQILFPSSIIKTLLLNQGTLWTLLQWGLTSQTELWWNLWCLLVFFLWLYVL